MSEEIVKEYLPDVFTGKSIMPGLWKRIASQMRARREGVAIVSFFPQSRGQQNTYNSALEDLAEQCELSGERRTSLVWKRFTLSAFYEGTRHDPEYRDDWEAIDPVLLADVDSDGVHLIAVKSQPLSKRLASAYLSFLHSIGDERGVKWRATSIGREAANDAAAGRAKEAA